MLVLNLHRCSGQNSETDEHILINGNVKIFLIRVAGQSARLGIEAPREVPIVRSLATVKTEPKPRPEVGE